MQDKNTLINSMNNLIKYKSDHFSHISISRRNQQQMFASLSRKDFDKIISNLDDSLLSTQKDDAELRITTVKLLTELLYTNEGLKRKFCELMGIQFYSNSNIVLNSSLQKILEKYSKKQAQLYTVLKLHIKSLKQAQTDKRNRQPLLWYINPKNIKLTVQYIQRQQFALISTFTSKNVSFDPLECVFGVSLYANDQQQNQGKSVSSLAATTDASKVKHFGNNKQQSNPSQNTIASKGQQPNYHRPVNYQPVYIPMSVKSAAFSKQNHQKIGNFSFTSGSSQAPYQIKNSLRQGYKPEKHEQQVNFSYDAPPHYVNMSSVIQNQPNSTTSKKQNEERYWKQNEKYSNRLSLQLNDFKIIRKVNQFEAETSTNNVDMLRVETKTQPSQHCYGIKIVTPRESLREGQKISIMKNGAQTQRTGTEREKTISSITQRQKTSESIGESGQRIKTIHLGGFRGLESVKEKRNMKIQRH